MDIQYMYTYLGHLRLPVIYHCLALRHEEINIFFVEEIHVEISNNMDEGRKYTCKYQIQVHYTLYNIRQFHKGSKIVSKLCNFKIM